MTGWSEIFNTQDLDGFTGSYCSISLIYKKRKKEKKRMSSLLNQWISEGEGDMADENPCLLY